MASELMKFLKKVWWFYFIIIFNSLFITPAIDNSFEVDYSNYNFPVAVVMTLLIITLFIGDYKYFSEKENLR